MRCLYPRCEHGRVVEQGECSDCLRAENERLKAARLEHSSLCEGSVGLPCDLPSVCDPLRAEVERLRREYDVRAVIERCPAHDAPTLVDGYQRGRMRISCAECNDAENERLRGLIAQVEWVSGGYIMGPPSCPWCEGQMEDGHTPDCPAFSARGEVRR